MRILLVLLVWLAASGGARAETVATCDGYVDTLPAVISTSGTWCLRRSIATTVTSGTAIQVAAHHVTLDCNGFRIGGLGGGTSTLAVGIRATDMLNLTVRNCVIRGFFGGIVTIGGAGHRIEGNTIESSRYVGLFIGGENDTGTAASDNSVVRDNQVTNTGAVYTIGVGIAVAGAVDVIGNVVSSVTALSGTSPSVRGITIADNPGTLVERNIVRGLLSSGGISYAIFLNIDSGRVFFRENDLMGRSTEVLSYGIRCDGGESPALLHGNALLNFTYGTTGCTDGGNNTEVNL